MAMHGHIYDPKRDVDPAGVAGAGGVAGLLEQFESGDSTSGGLGIIHLEIVLCPSYFHCLHSKRNLLYFLF